MTIKSICVYCASNRNSPQKWRLLAKDMGEGIATRNLKLIYGGASIGLMGEVADAAMANGGSVIGVIPESLNLYEVAHQSLGELIVTMDMHERKKTMFELSDAFIALPGGIGTLEEILEIAAWKYLGIHIRPVIVLNQDGYYDSLLTQFQRCADEGLMRYDLIKLFKIVQTVDEAFILIDSLNSVE